MGVITVILYTVVILTALLLIGLILVQQSKGGGFGSAFGGAGDSVFGAHAGTHLTKLTVIMTTIFFVLTLALAIITGHKAKSKSVIEVDKDLLGGEQKVEQKVEKKAAAPVAAKPVEAKKASAQKLVLDKKGEKIPVPVLKTDKKNTDTKADKKQ
jgi:preprotein translocase subunit SecG